MIRSASFDHDNCAAIIDRLTFNGTIIETGTDSYRRYHSTSPNNPRYHDRAPRPAIQGAVTP